MTEQVPFKYLVEALAELFGLDEVEVLNLLIQNGVGSWRDFVRFVSLQRLEDRQWKV